MSVGISLVRALVDAIERSGVDPERYLEAGGLDERLLDDPAARIELSVYDRLQELAISMSGDPAFGLHMGEHASLGAFSLVGHLGAQCRTIRDGLEVFFRYYRIVTDVKQPYLVDDGDRVRIVYQFPRTRPICDRMRAEFGMTRLLMIGKLFLGDERGPSEVWFEHAPPEYGSEYQRIFEGAQRFEMPQTGMVIERELLDTEQRYFDPTLFNVLREQAEKLLRHLSTNRRYTDRVRDLVLTHAVSTQPTVAEVSRELGLSGRALRRRLADEGTSFSVVVDSARSELARRILAEAETTLKEAAYRMGYSEVSAFHRAFKRWTGETPTTYRRSLP